MSVDESVRLVGMMVDKLAHRGPDDRGAWVDRSGIVGLGHRRLSILDLSEAGRQPMHSPSGRYTIAFNGEIYNHLDLRRRLSSHELNWRGHSDTETLLAAFDRWGIAASVEQSVGMFAMAVWDHHNRQLTLIRDRLGEKPLYYGRQAGSWLFGSEIKALRPHPAFEPDIDRHVLALFMRHSYIPAPYTIYRNLWKLPPGALVTLSASAESCTPVKYWSVLETAASGQRREVEGSDDEIAEQLEALLSGAVKSQQLSDVPIGAFLSGGIDSSTIVALMQRQTSAPIRTFTIGYENDGYDEGAYAKTVAAHLGTLHTEHYVTAKETLAVVPQLPNIYDEPFADSSQIPTLLISRLARRDVTVCLSGDGGDELFGGYNRYAWTRRLLRYPVPIRRLAARVLTSATPMQWTRIFNGAKRYLPLSAKHPMFMLGDQLHKLASVLDSRTAEDIYLRLVAIWQFPTDVVLGSKVIDPVRAVLDGTTELGSMESRMMAVDAMTYLPGDILTKVDRASMSVSLETRVPFLDHRVVEFAWRLPLDAKIRGGQGKWLLRQVLHRYVPSKLVDRPKMGFGVPIATWIRTELRDWAESLLDDKRLESDGYLDAAELRRTWNEHVSLQRNWQYRLWNALMFQAWLEATRGETEGANRRLRQAEMSVSQST